MTIYWYHLGLMIIVSEQMRETREFHARWLLGLIKLIHGPSSQNNSGYLSGQSQLKLCTIHTCLPPPPHPFPTPPAPLMQ